MSAGLRRTKNQRIRQTAGDRLFDIFNMAFWIVTLVIILYPMYLIIIASVSSPEAITASRT